MKSSPSIRHLLHSVKSTVKISSIFVAFLKIINFTHYSCLKTWLVCEAEKKSKILISKSKAQKGGYVKREDKTAP